MIWKHTRLSILLAALVVPVVACAESADAGSTPFAADLEVPIPGRDPDGTMLLHLIGSCQPCAIEDPSCATASCAQVTTTQEMIRWPEDFEIAGEKIKQSVWIGKGLWVERLTAAFATGFEWTILENGDIYLSRWDETISSEGISGEWVLVYGTGKLDGITGQAKITCQMPDGGSTIEKCRIEGAYTLAE